MGGIIFWGQTLPLLAEDTAFEFFQEEAVENTRVSIASKKDTSIRETPGIVTLITREEIQNSGARDLLDILTLFAPGMNFGSDVEGVVSAYVRGIWAEEGKILLLMDGLEMNERVFDTTQFGNHFSADDIDRIEIIRGPGSAIYGGFAELAVINVITRGAKENGAYVTALNSQIGDTYSHRGVTAGFGKTVGNFSSSMSGTFSKGHRSDENITDFNGDTRRLSNQLNPSALNLHLGYKGFSTRTIGNWYNTTHIDNVGTNYTDGELFDRFHTVVSEAKYDLKPMDGLTITPRLEFKKDQPWISDQNYIGYTNHKWAERKTAGLTSSWDINPQINALAGFEYNRSDVFRAKHPGPFDEIFKNGENNIGSNNYAWFGQGMAYTPLLNVTVGARYDRSDQFGSAFVPRFALTKVIDRFHFKTMASQSFRTPVGILPNRTLPGAGKLDPEKATNYEVELGYKFTQSLWWVVNAFDVRVNKTIVYGTDPVSGVGYYGNFGKIGTRGVESDIRFRHKKVDLTANYAFYDVTKNEIPNYALPDHPNLLLGAPAHRVNVIANVKITRRTSLNPSASYYSKRYAFVMSGQGEKKFDPVTIYNINLRMKDIVWNGTRFDLGVHDIFDKGFEFLPGYNSAKGALPGPSRAVVVKIGYTYKF